MTARALTPRKAPALLRPGRKPSREGPVDLLSPILHNEKVGSLFHMALLSFSRS